MHGEDPSWLAWSRQVAALDLPAFGRALDACRTDAEQRDLYRARFRWRVREFLRFVLPDVFDLPWNDYHRHALDAPKDHWRARAARGEVQRNADAAPRGIAKTTTRKGDVLHDVCYGLEGFVVVIANRQDDAIGWAKTLRGWTEHPTPQLAWLFGPFTVKGGVEEFSIAADGGVPVPIATRALRTPIRGINYRSQRPTRIIPDDLEDRIRVRNPDLRREERGYLTDDVLKCGPRQGGLKLDLVGTVLHPDSALARMLSNAEPFRGFKSSHWRAVKSWPERRDLWDRCGRIYTNLAVGDVDARRAAARAFYEAHRAAMDAGVEVLDEHALPIWRVYEYVWTDGLSSVLRELQNEPIDPSTQLFDSSKFHRCRVEHDDRHGDVIVAADGRRVPLHETVRRLWWDPSNGGDTAALVVMARDRHGYRYVVDAWVKAVKFEQQVDPFWSLCERWGIKTARIGATGMYGFESSFRRFREERKAASLYHTVQLDFVTESVNKQDHIVGTLEVPVTNGWLQFSDALPAAYFAQFDAFSVEASARDAVDDGAPDATSKAYSDLDTFAGPRMAG